MTSRYWLFLNQVIVTYYVTFFGNVFPEIIKLSLNLLLTYSEMVLVSRIIVDSAISYNTIKFSFHS